MSKYHITLSHQVNNVYEVECEDPYLGIEILLASPPDRFPLVDSYMDGAVEYTGFELVGDGE